MKMSQWVGVLAALVAVVFGVTYLRMSVPVEVPKVSREPRPGKTKQAPELTFAEVQFPPGFQDTGKILDQEHKTPSYHDFWFENRNDEALKVGAVSKNCKCQGIDVYTLPEGWRPAGTDAATPDTKALEGQAHKTELNPNEPDGQTEIPAHAFGWVRMRWTAQVAGPQLLKAVLWTGDRNVGATAALEVKAFFHHAVEVLEGERPLGVHATSDLPLETALVCFSPTRAHFGLKAEAYGERPDPKADPFVVGAPVPLTAQECRQLQQVLAERAGKNKDATAEEVRGGYKVPVTLKRVAPDGKTPFELGNFRRVVRLTPDVPAADPIDVTVSGNLRGDVVVGFGDERVPLQFGTFDRGKSPRRTTSLRTTTPGLTVEVDRRRLPDFLEAALSGPEADGPTRTWTLEVRVLGDKVPAGEFPADTAVYLRTGGPDPQTVRIPVGGNAADRGR